MLVIAVPIHLVLIFLLVLLSLLLFLLLLPKTTTTSLLRRRWRPLRLVSLSNSVFDDYNMILNTVKTNAMSLTTTMASVALLVGSMCLRSIYLGLEGVPYIGT